MKLYWELLTSFLKIGAFTLGGGYAMIPLIQREVVDRRQWISEENFLTQLALAQSVPGIMAVNTAFFVGYSIKGWKGAGVAILGAILPSFLMILLIVTCFIQYKQYPAVEAVFKGIRPAIVALIVAPLYRMAKSAKISWLSAIVPITACLLIWLGGLSPIWIIAATIMGALGYTYLSERRHR